jgi:twinkle protein
MENLDSVCLGHGPCDSCGSRDNNALYSDGHKFCFGCSKYTPADGESTGGFVAPERGTKKTADLVEDLSYTALNARGLTLQTCQFWEYGIKEGVYVAGKLRSVQVAQYRDPATRQVVAQHVKFMGDDGKKDFRWFGDKKKAGLFGMHLWPNGGGKMVVITEGEIDAMTVSQMQDHRFPVYSVPNGAAAAKNDLAPFIDFLETSEKIVLLFDSDAAGQKAAEECAQLFTPGKAVIAKLPLKDANEMLQAGRPRDIIDAIFRAQPYRPDGIVFGTALWDAMMEEEQGQLLPFPWARLNDKIRGLRAGQILLIAAGTGIGKSTVARYMAAYWHDQFNEKVAIIALEEPLFDTTCELIALKHRRRDVADLPREELKELFDSTMDAGWCLYNHMGSVDFDTLVHRIRYFARVCGCKTIIFDHIMAAVEGQDDADNAAVSRAMNHLRSLAGELGIRLIMPTHLKSVEGKAFEEGAAVRLADLKWPALRQYANKIIAIERDQQSKDPTAFKFRVLKCRGENGQTGLAGGARWDPNTGQMPEVEVADGGGLDVPDEPEKESNEQAPF